MCVRCGVCRDTLKTPRVYIHNIPVCTGNQAHGDALDAYTPSSLLNTQPHTATHNRAQHNGRQSTNDDYKHTQRSQAPATRDRPPERTRNTKPRNQHNADNRNNRQTQVHGNTRDETLTQSQKTTDNTTDRQQTHKERQRQTHDTKQQRNTKHSTRIKK